MKSEEVIEIGSEKKPVIRKKAASQFVDSVHPDDPGDSSICVSHHVLPARSKSQDETSGVDIILKTNQPQLDENIIKPQPTIILFCHKQVEGLPSSEPSSICLETYLRMLRLKYQMTFNAKPATQAWICIDTKAAKGIDCAASLIRNYTGLDLNKDLKDNEISIVRFTSTTLECQTECCLMYNRWMKQLSRWKLASAEFKGGNLFKNLMLEIGIQRRITNRLTALGLDTVPSSNIYITSLKDIEALSNLLGTNKFYMGSSPCSLDCVSFGIVTSIIDSKVEDTLKDIIFKRYRNLVEHCATVKSLYWPDWNAFHKDNIRHVSTPRPRFSFRRSKCADKCCLNELKPKQAQQSIEEETIVVIDATKDQTTKQTKSLPKDGSEALETIEKQDVILSNVNMIDTNTKTNNPACCGDEVKDNFNEMQEEEPREDTI